MIGIFTILAALTIAGAVAAMTLRSLIHAVLALVLAFAGLATLYLSLGAQFVGFAQMLVYIGAVAILTVFAILLTRGSDRAVESPLGSSRPSFLLSSWIAGVVIAAAVFGVLARAIATSSVSRSSWTPEPQISVKTIGDALMGPFVLPLEVLGLLLTGALVGAVIIAMHERKVSP